MVHDHPGEVERDRVGEVERWWILPEDIIMTVFEKELLTRFVDTDQ